MLDIVAWIYAGSTAISALLAVYCMTRDRSWRRHSLGDIFGPVLIPGLNTVIAICSVFVLWVDLHIWLATRKDPQ